MSEYLSSRGWLERGEAFRGCERAGEGNMNLTLRVRTDRRRFVLKQARPWVEKYPDIAAPWDRSLAEQRFYAFVAPHREVASRMPRLLGADPDGCALLLEDLPGARDRSDLYAGAGAASGALSATHVRELAAFARALHRDTEGPADPALANRAMRALNHAHLFEIPLSDAGGLDLDAFEPGLARAADLLRDDDAYRARVEDLGRRYLGDSGRCLVHGDYFPGSWLDGDLGLRVIDPEFGFFGDPELDLGMAIAHLALARQPAAVARDLLDAYSKGEGAPALDASRLARYAAVEVMRRLIGVAQLPLPETDGFRAALLLRSQRAMGADELDALFAGGSA